MSRLRGLLLVVSVLAFAAATDPSGLGVLTVGTASLTTTVGGTVTLDVSAMDRGGAGPVEVLWSSTAGRWSIEPGETRWTAPWTPGTYTLVARHPQAALTFAEVVVTVQARSVAATTAPNGVPAAPSSILPLGIHPAAAFRDGDGTVLVSQAGFTPIRRLPTSVPVSWSNDRRVAYALAGGGVAIGELSPMYDNWFDGPDLGDAVFTSVALQPEGPLVAAAAGPVVSVFDTRTGFTRFTWTAPSEVVTLAWEEPTGARLFVGAGGHAYGLDLVAQSPALDLAIGDRGFRFDGDHWLFAIDAAGNAGAAELSPFGGRLSVASAEDPVVAGSCDGWLSHDFVLLHASGRLERVTPGTGTVAWSRTLDPRPSAFLHVSGARAYAWYADHVDELDLSGAE